VDEKSWQLLKNIAQGTSDSKSLKSTSKLTRKQYYSRVSRMTRSKLVTKRNGKYRLTTFGKIVYQFQLILENALEDHWKLKTIDSLELSKDLPQEDREKLIDTLFENQDLKQILSKG
jgi:predicted transcriptional regulator